MTREEAIKELSQVDEIGKTTAECLYEIGICSPQALSVADPNEIVRHWEVKKNEKVKGFSSSVTLKYVTRWVVAAQTDTWEYSQALEKLRLMKDRGLEKGLPCDINKDAFLDFYGKDKDRALRTCQYCGISEADLDDLFSRNLVYTTRKVTRGRSMEIDRKDPKKGYIYHSAEDNNLALSCYWCNNAKTDEFSYTEFKEVVGPVMAQVWQRRLNER